MTEYLYTTKRKMLMEERQYLVSALQDAYEALHGLISGEITSYNLGKYSISRNRVDLDKLRGWMEETRLRINEIDNILSGRPVRTTTTCVYSNPQVVRYWG
mgnify:CR=1 FL=1